MNIKFKNKKHIMKISAFVALLVFVSALLFNINILNTKADMKDVTVDNCVSILEIGPGGNSRLRNGVGSDTTNRTYNGIEYKVTYMSMPEYISKIDDIAGKYDIVVITNNVDGLEDYFYNDNVLDSKYTKYSTEFNAGMSYMKYSEIEQNKYNEFNANLKNEYSSNSYTYREYYSENDITDKRAAELLDMANRGQLVCIEKSALISGSKIESNFKNESKITKLETINIENLINLYNTSSKRPVISEFKVSKDDSDKSLGTNETRAIKFSFKTNNTEDFLVKVYLDWNADGMFKHIVSDEDKATDELVKTTTIKQSDIKDGVCTVELNKNFLSNFVGYLDWKVEVYSGTDENTNTKTDIISSLTFKRLSEDDKINLKVLQVYPDKMNIFDDNGTYKGYEEYEKSGLVLSGELNVSIDSNSNNGTEGVFLNSIDKTITIKQKSSANKLYICGEFNNWSKEEMTKNGDFFEITLNYDDVIGKQYKFYTNENNEEKWILDNGNKNQVDDGSSNKNNIIKEDDSVVTLNDVSKRFKEYMNKVEDYNVTIDSIPVTEFNINCLDETKKSIMESYDMIIIGFADSYGGSYDFNTTAISVIQKYVDERAVMFSHDTMSLDINKASTKNDNGYSDGTGAVNLTNVFKSVVGQSRYENDTIINDGVSYKSLGQTLYAIRKNPKDINPNTMYTRDDANFYEQSKTKTVREVNGAQITSYPYDLSSSNENSFSGKVSSGSIDGNNSINISQTHTQWYQLDLENENISPWFNLVADGSYKDGNAIAAKADQYNSGDARNFYYTYSIGNITYSGTGHTSNYTDSELKLFVNTIIKASRGSYNDPTDPDPEPEDPNEAPIIKSYDTSNNLIDNGSEIQVGVENDFKIYTTADDADGDDVDMTISISNQDTLTHKVIGGDSSVDGNKKEVVITKQNLKEVAQVGGTIILTVNATDGKDAANPHIYTIVPMQTYNIQHGMYKLTYRAGSDLTKLSDSDKLQEITDWYDGTDFNDGLISRSTDSVSYFSTVPFAAKTTVYKGSSLQLTIDHNLKVSDSVKVYKVVESASGEESLEYIKDMTLQEDGVYTCDLSELTDFTTEIVVKYKAKTMAQPEVKDEEPEVREFIIFTNTINVLRNNVTVSSANASVQVGQSVLDRDLF